MKKSRTLKLNLNKKKVSTLDANEVKGGHYSCTPTCTQTALYSRCGNMQCH
ncbi:hypothetical protein [uncultured Kordia sp.]|uniref:hypothetical protein n=1 Tax=uncultured Kordia sp. TaxID=507699 RepID=UPI0026113EC8|nr:hypothetical protein [uncultured Kordia sp.]